VTGLAIACTPPFTGTPPGPPKPSRFSGVPIWRLNRLAVATAPTGASPLEHNCSGKHAAFLAHLPADERGAGVSLQDRPPLPAQLLKQGVSLLGLPGRSGRARDDVRPHPADAARPDASAVRPPGGSSSLKLERLSRRCWRTLYAHVCLVCDTELMRRSHGLVVSKGGARASVALARMARPGPVRSRVVRRATGQNRPLALGICSSNLTASPARTEENSDKQVPTPGLGLELAVQGSCARLIGFQSGAGFRRAINRRSGVQSPPATTSKPPDAGSDSGVFDGWRLMLSVIRVLALTGSLP